MSFKSCCIPGCKTRDGDGIPLHRFPHNRMYPDKFRLWVLVSGADFAGIDDDYIRKNRRICRLHFADTDLYPNNRLCPLAVPTSKSETHLARNMEGSSSTPAAIHTNEASDIIPILTNTSLKTKMGIEEATGSETKRFCICDDMGAHKVVKNVQCPLSDHNYFKKQGSEDEGITGTTSMTKRESTSEVKEVLQSASGSKAVIDCEPPTDTQTVEEIDRLIVKDAEFSHETLEDGIVDDDDSTPRKIKAYGSAKGAFPCRQDSEAEFSRETLEDGIVDNDDSTPRKIKAYGSAKGAFPCPQDSETETASVEPLFSWEKSELIPADEPEEPGVLEEVPGDPSAVSLYDDDVTSLDKPAEQVSLPSEPVITVPREVEYKCKECGETITGFQFWCVQCLGCALCGACEARGAHRAHYVLRAPAHRPHRQTQVVLAAIRHQLQNENMLTTQETGDGVVKLEIKEEPIEHEVALVSEAPLDSDPLAAPDGADTSFSDDDAVSQVSQESQLEEDDDLEEIIEPQPKRPRLAEINKPQPKKTRLADFIEQDFIPPEKPKGSPLPVKVTGAPPQQVLIDLEEFEEVEYLDTEGLETLEANTKELDGQTNPNIMILGDADRNIVVQRVIADNEDDATYQILGNVDNDWIVQRGVTLDTDETENRLPTRGPQELMARSLTTKAVVKLQPLSSVEIRKWTASKRRRLK